MRTRVHTSVTQSAAATAVEDLWPQRSGCEPDGLVLPAAPAGGVRLVSPELRTPARRSHRRGCNASNRQQNILPNHTARSLSGRWHYGRQYNGSAEHVAMYHGEPRPVVDFAALATKSEPPSRPVPSQIHSTAQRTRCLPGPDAEVPSSKPAPAPALHGLLLHSSDR